MQKSQSEGTALSNLGSGSEQVEEKKSSDVVEGKRRRVEEPESTTASIESGLSAAQALIAGTSKPSAVATPARSSPLWQVSKAGRSSLTMFMTSR